jgi:transposase
MGLIRDERGNAHGVVATPGFKPEPEPTPLEFKREHLKALVREREGLVQGIEQREEAIKEHGDPWIVERDTHAVTGSMAGLVAYHRASDLLEQKRRDLAAIDEQIAAAKRELEKLEPKKRRKKT